MEWDGGSFGKKRKKIHFINSNKKNCGSKKSKETGKFWSTSKKPRKNKLF